MNGLSGMSDDHLMRPMMTNADLGRIINSDEVPGRRTCSGTGRTMRREPRELRPARRSSRKSRLRHGNAGLARATIQDRLLRGWAALLRDVVTAGDWVVGNRGDEISLHGVLVIQRLSAGEDGSEGSAAASRCAWLVARVGVVAVPVVATVVSVARVVVAAGVGVVVVVVVCGGGGG